MARILVVDDDPAVRDLMSVVMRLEGHSVEEAAEGGEALSALERALPDLVLLDLAMPGMNGWRFLDELHRRGLRRSTRVVIVSGRYDGRRIHPQTRVHRVIAKPFDPQDLSAAARAALAEPPDALYERTDRTRSLARLLRKLERAMR